MQYKPNDVMANCGRRAVVNGRKQLHSRVVVFAVVALTVTSLSPFPLLAQSRLPAGFVYATSVVPDLILDIRYAGEHNFVGERIPGYDRPVCILSRQAAEALGRVQKAVKRFGLGLKVFDCYRPQRAVNHFIAWAKDLRDIRSKAEFYPNVAKKDLFKDGYIAARSSHSRGSTVDLTLAAFDEGETPTDIDMGTGFDLFSPKSWPTSMAVNGSQRAHRMLLQVLMKSAGFAPYPQEWWHFTLAGEPFPDTYFDFPVD